MSHRVSRCVVLLGALTGGVLLGCGSSDGRPPNIILISIDTLRPDYLGCYGNERDVSPALDRLAREGTVFEDVTAPSPWTLPSHASMLTGMYPSTHGVQTNERGLTETTLATWLQQAGYQTLAVVNGHNVGWPAYGLLAGFERSENIPEVEVSGGPILNRAETIIRRGVDLLNASDGARPFFLFLHFYDVHTDLTPQPQWEREYVDPYEGPMSPVTKALVKLRGQMLRGAYVPSEADLRYLTQMYDAEIRSLDERLQTFFDALDAAGLAQETLVCVTSDHGEEFAEHGGLLHGRTHYQELVRIPWILRGPGVPSGRRVEQPVHLVDVVPTLLALAGLPQLPGVDGYDVSPAQDDSGAEQDAIGTRFLYSEADHNNVIDGRLENDFKRMIRQGNTVLHYDLKTGRKELYDLATDPWEQEDLAAQRPEQVERLFGRLEQFMARKGSARELGEVSEETQRLLEGLGYGGDG